ncbi:MAG TPA: hypothetical protein GXX75_06880 [Clostridiales bacterium]|nr:hypothetical protein [Clostridiales bacterium]
MTEIEVKKRYLKSYIKNREKLKTLEDQLQSLIESSRSAKAQSISDMPKGNIQTDLSDVMVRQDELFAKIIRLKAECQQIMLNIENGIAEMEDGIESAILYKKYIKGEQFEDICMEIGYSWRQTHRHHGNALMHFKIPIWH